MAEPKRVEPKGRAAAPATPDQVATTDSIKELAARLAQEQANFKISATREGTLYIRNIRGIGARISLDSGRRIELAPRGQIGDLAPVSPDEQYDSKFVINRDLLYEVISTEDARKIIQKQSINAQQERTNPLFDVLRSETGEAYKVEDIHTKPQEGPQPIMSGTVESAPDGRNTTGNTDIVRNQNSIISDGFTHVSEAKGPQRAAVPGSVENPMGAGPSDDLTARDVREFLEWRQAKRLREELSVTVDEHAVNTDAQDEAE